MKKSSLTHSVDSNVCAAALRCPQAGQLMTMSGPDTSSVWLDTGIIMDSFFSAGSLRRSGIAEVVATPP